MLCTRFSLTHHIVLLYYLTHLSLDRSLRAETMPEGCSCHVYLSGGYLSFPSSFREHALEQLFKEKSWIGEDPIGIARAIKQFPDANKIIGELTSKYNKNALIIRRLRKEKQDYSNLIMDGIVLLVESYEKGEKRRE